MKLKNKKTGEIVDVKNKYLDLGLGHLLHYNSLAELNEEWEDYEEPEMFYIVDHRGKVGSRFRTGDEYEKMFKEIGNYFETEEEAEKAVEKLKAWKRLKDKGLHATTFYVEDGSLVIRAKTHNSSGAENWEDLDLLFGGEE